MFIKIGLLEMLEQIEEKEDLVNFLASHPPKSNSLYFNQSVQKIKKNGLRPGVICPRFLYATLPRQSDVFTRFFAGAYLLDPKIIIPLASEIKKEHAWLNKQPSLFNKKSPSIADAGGCNIDDLYEGYLRRSIYQLEAYKEAVTRFVKFDATFLKSLKFSPVLEDLLFNAGQELEKAKALVSEYKRRKAPPWMYFSALRKVADKTCFVKLLNDHLS